MTTITIDWTSFGLGFFAAVIVLLVCIAVSDMKL